MGLTHFLRGDPAAACEHFERGVALYDPSQHRSLAALYQADPGVFVRIWMAWALWVLGLPDQALARSREGLEMAREAGHPFTLGYTLLWTANVHLWRREREAAGRLAEEAIEIGREQELAFVLAGGRLIRAVARLVPQAEAAEIEAASAEFQQALAAFGRAGSTGAGRPHTLGELAAALAGVGRDEPARAFIDSALAFSEQTSQSYWDAELLRLRGELLLRHPSGYDEGERALRQALEVARKQRARMLELRAAVSLGRLLLDRGDRDEARSTLAGIYAAFTEGLDTADLAEARALLDQLA
jgi:predicted ATPase